LTAPSPPWWRVCSPLSSTRGAIRAIGEDPFWKPFYRRIDPEVLFSWTWKFLASFVAPLILIDWLLGSERVYSALPVGTFGWEAFATATARHILLHVGLAGGGATMTAGSVRRKRRWSITERDLGALAYLARFGAATAEQVRTEFFGGRPGLRGRRGQ
jgi:hypothetical protein